MSYDWPHEATLAEIQALLATPRDWKEDAAHENGNYTNKCVVCNQLFTGHKRRVVCRKCTPNSRYDTAR